MASWSWKCAGYVVVGVIVLILIILLNFDYLPKRRLSEDLEFTVKDEKSSWLSSPTPQTSTGSSREKGSYPQMTVSEYIDKISAWNCSAKPTVDGYPELTLDEFEKIKWNCSSFPTPLERFPENVSKSICYEYNDPFICVHDPVQCKYKDKSSDKRYPVRPVYGEYKYLPKSIWLSAVLHGGVAFLYHPCTAEKLVQELKTMAVSCLRRHIITPYENLSPCKPIAMVAWGCFYATSKINSTQGKDWIRQKAMQAPASHVSENGQFKKGLLHHAVTVSDKHETHLCPSRIKSLLLDDEAENDQNSMQRKFALTGETFLVKSRQPSRKFDTYNAAWALGSLIFLCLILGGVLIYTQPWQNRNHWWSVDNYNSNTRFNLMKNARLKFKRKTFQNKKSSAYPHLLSSIPEEFEDDI